MLFEEPVFELIEFDASDIVTASNIGGGGTCTGSDSDCGRSAAEQFWGNK